MKKTTFLPILFGVLICGAVYIPHLNAPLIWDDYGTIVLNSEIEKPIPLREFLTPTYFDFSKEQSWRPLATLSYYVLLRIKGKTPWLLRSLLLSAHLLNGLLLWGFLLALGLSPEISSLSSAFFLVHPAHTETLMCLSFNEELLVAAGLLLMLLAHRKRCLALTAAGYSFAVLSKETGILGLPLIFLCDLLIPEKPSSPRRRPGSSPNILDPSIRWGDYFNFLEYAVLSLIAVVYLWIRFLLLTGPISSGTDSFLAIPYRERLYFALLNFIAAIRIFFLPFWLRVEYFALPPESVLQGLANLVIGLGLLGIIFYGIKRLWKTNRVILYLLIWPFLFLFITSGVVPAQQLNLRYMAERWLYLPYLGACAVLAYGLSQISKKPALPLLLMIFWGASGYSRVRDWAKEPRLWSSLAAIYPWSAKAQEGFGESLFRETDYSGALSAFQTALRLRESREDKILAHYAPLERGGIIRWESPSLYRWLGRAYLKTGDMGQAETYSLKALDIDPKDQYTYRLISYGWAESGNFKRSGLWANQGLRIYPGDELLFRLKSDSARRKLTVHANFD